MKKIVYILLLTLMYTHLFAANGDSTIIRVWDKFPMNTFGAFDKKVQLPPASQKSQRILLKYTLGCTSNGQCEWDYDIALFARKNTGAFDSTLKQAPYLKVNNVAKDSISFSNDTTWVNVYNKTTKRTDSIPTSIVLITLFADSINNPLQITDSLRVFTANYYRYMFDSTGKKTDSTWVMASNTIYQHLTPYFSVFNVYENYEMGRLISPYAKQFPKSFAYDYIFDVTDYAKFLKDSGEFRIYYSGYSYGFTATWDLIYIEGTPAKEVIDIVNIYNGGYTYGGSTSIEAALSEKTFTVPAGTASVTARIIITGHGGESSENCAEFCAKNYFLTLNNQQIAKQLVWRDDCGSNPITAQGGTWIYNRSNWCPGELVKKYEHNLNVLAETTNTINMDMDDFIANGNALYKIALQLIYYKNNTYQNDAAIEEILAPTKNLWHSKTNPICDNAKVIIKNYGAQPLTDAWISATLGNGTPTGKMWTGNLAYGESAEFTLPDLIWPADLTNKTFTAEIKTINGKAITIDENSNNNMLTSQFDLPITVTNTFIVETRTNGRPEQNSYTITDSKGTIYKSRTFSNASTLHRDTITLGFGCYTFKFNDDNVDGEGNNGLGWWAAAAEGNGSLRLVSFNPTKVHRSFSLDFGTFTQLNFRVQHSVGLLDYSILTSDVIVYPSPANDVIYIEGIDFEKAILYTISGKQIATFNNLTTGMDVKSIPTGIYILALTTANNQTIKKKISIQQ